MNYLKGQLHLHTTMSDGDASPEIVAKEFKEMGYDFIVYTDHNCFHNVDHIKEKDFLPIPGVEWAAVVNNSNYNDVVKLHVNSLGFRGKEVGAFADYCNQYNKFYNYPLIDFGKSEKEMPLCEDSVADTLNVMLKTIYEQGVVPTVNHPNWMNFDFDNIKVPKTKYEKGKLTEKQGSSFAPFDYRELLGVNYPYILEVRNIGLPDFSSGFKCLESCEYIWDVLLTNGKNVLAAFTDDSHKYSKEIRKQISNFDVPGQTFVMVNADLNEDSILNGLRNGDFYGSSGPELEYYEVDDKKIKIKVKEKPGIKYNIIFKGRMGIPLAWTDRSEAVYEFKGIFDEEYVRVKVTDNLYETLLTQPVFQNGKKIILKI